MRENDVTAAPTVWIAVNNSFNRGRCYAALPDYARIQRWHRLPAELGHADGLYTENGRPKRKAIAEHFSLIINSLYVESARALSQ